VDASGREFGPGDWSILALLAEKPAHGWALAAKFKPEGEIGAVWSIPRPSIYRSLDTLKQRGFVETAKLEQSERGPYREVYRTTRRGRAALKEWLAEPVDHIRDIRSVFLLKLVLAARAGVDRKPMVRAQRDFVASLMNGMEGKPAPGTEPERLYQLFRRDSARALLRFLDDLLDEVPGESPQPAAEPATRSRRRPA
jgi:PadR family transcriptional regulator AphA